MAKNIYICIGEHTLLAHYILYKFMKSSKYSSNMTNSKIYSGTTGTAVDLTANYFTVETTPQWRLFQYHVDFSPDEDNTFMRRALMRVHANVLGG